MNVVARGLKNKLPWILLLAGVCAGFLIFWYRDIGDTLDNSVMLVEAVSQGRFSDFYRYSAENAAPATRYSANYNILLYIVFALWNLPTALAHIFTGFDYTVSVPALLWCKLLIVFVYLFLSREVYRLMKIYAPDDETAPKTAVYLMLSSLCAFVPAMIAVQYDCISLYFMLLGLRFYAQNKNVKFVLAFALSAPFKLFSLFIYVPILLLRHKNVFKILMYLVPVLLPGVLLELPFMGEAYFEAAMQSQNGDAVRLILEASASVAGIQLSINPFLISYFMICLFAYTRREPDALSEARMSVYFSFMAFSAFLCLTPIRSYWIVLYTPFLAMLVCMRKTGRAAALLTDTLAGAAGGLFVLANHWIYNTGEIVSRLCLKNLRLPEGTVAKYAPLTSYALPEGIAPEFGHLAGFLDSFGIGGIRFVFLALFIACCLFALVVLKPGFKGYPDKLKSEKVILLARPILFLAVTAMLVYVNFAPAPDVKFASAPVQLSESPLTGENAFTATVRFEKDASLTRLNMPCSAEGVNRTSRGMLVMTLSDGQDDLPLWHGKTGIATLIDAQSLTVEMDCVPVEKDKTYCFTLTYLPSEAFPDGSFYPYLSGNGEIAFSLQ